MTAVDRADNGMTRYVLDEERAVTLAAKVRLASRGRLARLWNRLGEWVWW